MIPSAYLLFRSSCQGLPARSSVKTTQGLPARSSVKTGHWPVFRALLTHRIIFRACLTPTRGRLPAVTPRQSSATKYVEETTVFAPDSFPSKGKPFGKSLSESLPLSGEGGLPQARRMR